MIFGRLRRRRPANETDSRGWLHALVGVGVGNLPSPRALEPSALNEDALRTEFHTDAEEVNELGKKERPGSPAFFSIALLTGGSDRPYVYGLTKALVGVDVSLDLIGSDELECEEYSNNPAIRFLNLRGSQHTNVGRSAKILRIVKYYARLIRYTATSKPKIFHILWNNKFEYFDRTVLMLYYRMAGKKIVFTVHNVNERKRDLRDSWLNRRTLRIQYQLSHHLFVHTDKMREELIKEFGVRSDRVSVIPFGINNALPKTALTAREAKKRLGLEERHRTVLFFGRITPYKGLEYLIAGFRKAAAKHDNYRLVIAGRVDRCEDYFDRIRRDLQGDIQAGRVILRAEFIPDDEAEIYLKAGDALVLPYKDIYQSGVLFLAHSFGLPVLAADVGSLKDDIVDGETGFLFRSEDVDDLAAVIERYFSSELYRELPERREYITHFARKRHSWDTVANSTVSVYSRLLSQ